MKAGKKADVKKFLHANSKKSSTHKFSPHSTIKFTIHFYDVFETTHSEDLLEANSEVYSQALNRKPSSFRAEEE